MMIDGYTIARVVVRARYQEANGFTHETEFPNIEDLLADMLEHGSIPREIQSMTIYTLVQRQ